jgi:4'-phosphopantetheinyl transferase
LTGEVFPALVPGVCQVWWARPEDVDARHDALLAPVDLQRRGRLRQEADRRRLTAAAAVVRMVVGAHAGLPPGDVEIDRTCGSCGQQHGKPWVPAMPDVHVSVSHSAGAVAVAVGRDGPIGVDVEELGEFQAAELESLAACVLTLEERAHLARLPVASRTGAFTTYWTRKEAVGKATGEGIALVDHVVVTPPSSPPRMLWSWGDGVAISLYPLHPPTGAVATLAVMAETAVRVVERPAGPLLRAVGGRRPFPQTRRRLSWATTRSQR